MGTFSQEQTVFSISMMANLGSGIIGSVDQIEAATAAAINTHLQDLQPQIGNWTVVWGPAIFQQLGSVRADNAMFVAQSVDDPNQYVVAIAGTNPYSAFDWIVEDVFVAHQVAWEFGTPPPGLSPAIADGTHRGLSILRAMRPGPTLPGMASTLQTFLAGLPAGAVSITTAGHSLGGALSPVTALWLSDTQSQWDPTGRATLSCLPSAGPTPGNQDFATYYASSPPGQRTTRLHNSIDVVPHAWAAADLGEIATLYQPAIPPDGLVKGLVFLAKQISSQGNYTQLNPAAPALAGTVNTSLIGATGLFKDFKNFITQMGYQHVDAYLELLGIPQLGPALAAVRGAAAVGFPAVLAAFEQKLLRRLAMARLRGLAVPALDPS